MSIQIILVNYNEIDGRTQPGSPPGSGEALLERYFPLRDWALGLLGAGLQVDAFMRSRVPEKLWDRGANYHFFPDNSPRQPHLYLPLQMHHAVARLARSRRLAGTPVVVHLNGLLFPLQARLLRWALGPETPIIGQHHGSQPWAPGVRRSIQRWGLRSLDGFMFAGKELARPWEAAGLIPPERVWEVMELSSHFRFQDRSVARPRTGLEGDPVILWAGNLDDNKDPLTVLEGFKAFLRDCPEARLYMAYRAATLLEKVRAFLDARPNLKAAVRLLGRIPYPQMELYFNSADIFVQGSAKEAAGLALLDALACGVFPVVTDIPAFRAVLKNGRAGALWPVGDPAGLRQALGKAYGSQRDPGSIRAFFEQNWHPDVIARQAASVYRQMVQAR